MFQLNRIFNLKNKNSLPFYTTRKSINESFWIGQLVYLIYYEWSGVANASLRSIETFFPVSNEYVDGSEVKRKSKKKILMVNWKM